MLLLAESHLAIHTWPERKGVTLDVYVCNFEADNSTKAQQLMSELERAFQAAQAQHQRIMRGDRDGPAAADDAGLLLETLNDNTVYGFRFARRLLERRTRYQHLELLQSDELGVTLRLDGCLMTSEADEFFYHEALIHPAAVAHPNPRRALIVGGGDGGALEELLKHPSIEQVTLVELDGEVVEVAREHLRGINRGSLDDPRVRVCIEDGAAFVRDTGERYDLVYLDLTDPETPAGPLYTEAFFAQCRRVLAPEGALVLHLGSPFHEPEQVRQLAGKLASVFAQVHGYGLHIPLYGSYWSLAVASDSMDPSAVLAADVADRLRMRGIEDLQYYNCATHGALFALPGFYRRLMPQAQVLAPAG
jgi:spermidine synthase